MYMDWCENSASDAREKEDYSGASWYGKLKSEIYEDCDGVWDDRNDGSYFSPSDRGLLREELIKTGVSDELLETFNLLSKAYYTTKPYISYHLQTPPTFLDF